MKIFASCHNHSCFSDAEYTPEKLVEIAHGLGHGGIILTDHDTVSGTYFIDKAARKLGMKSLLGCEFSTWFYVRGEAVRMHLLGFDFNPEHREMKKLLEYCPSVQTARSEMLFHMGLERGTLREGVTWQEVRDAFPYNDYICNNQVFKVMVDKGIYKPEEYVDAFLMPNFSSKLGLNDYIGEVTGKSYKNISTADVVRVIREAGGVPIVAHPAGKEKYAQDLLDIGVMGFETRHSIFRPERNRGGEESRRFFEELCDTHNLYKMGGSDHEGELGGYLEFGDAYYCPEELSGIHEEDFMKLYERKLG